MINDFSYDLETYQSLNIVFKQLFFLLMIFFVKGQIAKLLIRLQSE